MVTDNATGQYDSLAIVCSDNGDGLIDEQLNEESMVTSMEIGGWL